VRARLAMLVLACVVPPTLMGAVWIAYGYQQGKEERARESIRRARAIGSAVDRELAGIQGALSALATSPHFAGRDWAAFQRQATPLAATLGVSNIVVVDARLRQVVNTLRPAGSALPRDDNPLVREIFRAARPATSDAFVGPVAGKPLVATGIPVLDNGTVAYVLGAGMQAERLSELLARQRLPAGWIGAIFDGRGNIVARTHEMERFAGSPGAPALVKRMQEIAEGSVETETLEGIPVLSAFSRSALSNWTVAIGIPSRELEAELWRSLGWLLAAAALLAAATLAAAWRLGEAIARPIRALTALAERIGEGSAQFGAGPLGLREAEEVRLALRAAMDKLAGAEHRAHHDELTGLANQALFREIVTRQMALCRRERSSLAVLFADLDGFKAVNDELGHAAGDELLRGVAARLNGAIRGSDLAARLGGDEFGVLLLNADAPTAARVADKIARALAEPYVIQERSARIAASIGVAVFPGSGAETSEELVKRADEAMYRLKLASKGRRARA